MTHARHALVTAAFALCALGSGLAFAAPPIHAPWPCDVERQITQGHNTGSSHSSDSFDAWAWDVGLGEGESVVAPYDGVVRAVEDGFDVSCGIDGGCWRSTNHVVLAFDDGSEAQIMHLRMGSTGLRVGQLVRRGQKVGEIGLSGQITAAHLHFHVQNAMCSSEPWYCKSVSSSFVDIGDPGYPERVTSRNCELPQACIVGASDSLMIDDSSACFIDAAGSATWDRYDEPSDSYGYRYVPNTNGDATATGYWRFRVEETGLYRVEVQMPWWDASAGSSSVTYEVGSGTVRTPVGPINQIANSADWVVLGEGFLLREETESYVALSNETPEAAGSTLVGFDQVRITRVGDYVPESCAVGREGTEVEESGECFTTTGENWFDDLPGGRDGFRYSNSTAEANAREVGTWQLNVVTSEPYEIWVHVPDAAETTNAKYRLSNGYVDLELDPVDQSAESGWIKLTRSGGSDDEARGWFNLYAGLPASLSLGDATGEPFHAAGDERNTVVAFDSIAIAPAALGFDPNALEDKADDALDGEWGSARGGDEGGCACRASARSGGGSMALALLGLLALRRPRRRRRTTSTR
ncbi:golvesin C-terminal-like domain-containing protein [Paraliomyxa miuraensis]|uniref:golvesin C-terminal-like domain-containing protein n=1 Tax=Paraliomyxa miuraensis TaxID=376150 RepID=UPI002256688B|nr:peptidoglycan DD-metalloendopeptidase family protein [Paraliomyxa miuraensis]MCX4243029.1 peptidoglycan DD-metalloendopeptidase family protein [Paraliomyxa miuraensis]